MRPLLIALTAFTLVWAADTSVPRRIAFTRVAATAGEPELFIAASDGSGEHPLLPPDANAYANYDAAWSPDGKSIVFTSERNGSADLYRANPDGSGVTPLTNDPAYDDQAAFSPDGKRLVFVSSRGSGMANLWMLDISTRRARQLTSGPGGDFRPSWSPDGKWIAFSSSRGNGMPFSEGRWERLQVADLYIVHPDGSGLKKLTKSGNFCGSPKWMSDSRHVVAYCMTAQQTMPNRLSKPYPGNDTRLVSVDTTTGASTDLPAGPGTKINPSPLPSNEIGYIRKDSSDPGIYYASGKRGPRGAIRTASWSPDGTQVIFHKRVPGASWLHRTVWSRNPRYELSIVTGSIPLFNPDGDQFAISGTPPGEKLSALRVVTVKTSEARVVYRDKTRNVLAGAWSPAGDKIIFALGPFAAFFDGFHSEFLKPGDRVGGGAQIAIVNEDGTGFRELTSSSDNNAFPSFSPDGKRFVYRTFSSDGNGLRIMNLKTNAVTKLTSAYDNFPLWSPRGDLIMFARLSSGAYVPGGAYDIYTIKPDGTSLKRLTYGKGNDAHMSWSPDGEYITFSSSRMGFKDEVVYTDAPQPYGEIFVMRYDGTGVEQLTDNQWEDGAPGWQPTPTSQVASKH